MKSVHAWQKCLSRMLLGTLLLMASLVSCISIVQAADVTPSTVSGASKDANIKPVAHTGVRKNIYLFSTDFPPDGLSQYPPPAIQETRFWQLMDREMATTRSLRLTEDSTVADYQVDLRCTGILKCSKLRVDVKDPSRAVLVSFVLKGNNRYWGFGTPFLHLVARDLTQRLDEHLSRLPQGGYGNYGSQP